mmetsp:Transcript_3040/g.5440  ORF Transcript_3040/g.5440 Transcript_3040/m.5440 type:complete len:657 (-) Transcript_3040:160-2130(-)
MCKESSTNSTTATAISKRTRPPADNETSFHSCTNASMSGTPSSSLSSPNLRHCSPDVVDTPPSRKSFANGNAGGNGNGNKDGTTKLRYSTSSSSLRTSSARTGNNNSNLSSMGSPIVNVGPINITNFSLLSGMVGGGSFPPPLSKKQTRLQRLQLGWCLARLVLIMMITLWIGALVAVLRTDGSLSSRSGVISPGKLLDLGSPRALLNGIANHGNDNDNDNDNGNDNSHKRTSKRKKPKKKTLRGPSVPKPVDVNAPPLTISSPIDLSSISIFHSSDPSAFQFSTPDAPSCAAPLSPADVTFTLVTQLSEDRIWMIPHHCDRWGKSHPLSIVVFTDRSADDVTAQLVSDGCSPDQLAVQTVSKSRYDPTGTEYPVNILRNMAFSRVRTTHAVYADVDFWPSAELHDLLSRPSVVERFAGDAKLAVVVPAFQMTRRCPEYRDCRELNIPSMPRHKKALLSLVKKREASSFDPTNAGGHGSTKYITWRDQEAGVLKDLPCIKSNRYEPYLAVRYCRDLPPFQEGFTGYGKNKMTWAMQLRRTGYLFSQLGEAFLVHYPHLDSAARLEWNKKPEQLKKGVAVGELLEHSEQEIDLKAFKRARVDQLFMEFKKWMGEEVEDRARVPMCENSLNDDVRLWVNLNENGSGHANDHTSSSTSR